MGQEESSLVDDSVQPQSLSARSLPAVAEYIKSGDVKNIVVLTGAGISTAAGIPDFRSPKTGLYSNLARLNLPYAEAVFDISYFRQHPEPFYVLAQELYPGKFSPTVSHAFIALLAQKGLLRMLFTQNIDCLERRAGVPGDKVIEAHGSFATQRCIECQKEFPDDKMREHVFAGEVPLCDAKDCNGTVKPDIVFFGEQLPKSFAHNSHQAVMADLVLIIGTSLTVYPFAGLPDMTREGKPRVLFNMERVGQLGTRPDDVIQLGSCDDGIRKLADELGWRDELEALWRGVVGDKEADRQSRGQKKHDEDIEDEVERLAEGVESALNFDDSGESEDDATGTLILATEKSTTKGPDYVATNGDENEIPHYATAKESEKLDSASPESSKAQPATSDKPAAVENTTDKPVEETPPKSDLKEEKEKSAS